MKKSRKLSRFPHKFGKMKKIKVWLQYPWKFPDSPYYKYLIEKTPENIEYLNIENQKGAIVKHKQFWFLTRLKVNVRKYARKLGLNIPNAWKTKTRKNFDLIHCAHCISKNKESPWVADLESYWSMFVGDFDGGKSKGEVLKYLRRRNCKKILAWTKYTKKEIIKNLPEIKSKVEVVYPAITLKKEVEERRKNKITILYATRHFWIKGGFIALEVYKQLREKYGNLLELIFISDVPGEIKEKYPGLGIFGLVPSGDMEKLYKKADIFFYPSFADTFGFGLLEAMSYGIPIITINTKLTKTRKEIVGNGRTGFLFDVSDKITNQILKRRSYLGVGGGELKTITRLVQNCEKLIKNRKLREKMSRNCRNEVRNGKFSIKKRNKKLEKIYKGALK